MAFTFSYSSSFVVSLVRCRCFLFAQEKKTQKQDIKKELTYYLSFEEVGLNETGSDANEGLRRRYKVGPKNGISDKGISQEPLSYLQKKTYPEDDFSQILNEILDLQKKKKREKV